MRRLDIDTRRSLEDLHDGFFTRNFEDLTTTFCTIGQSELYNLVVRWELDKPISMIDHFGDEVRSGSRSYLDIIKNDKRSTSQRSWLVGKRKSHDIAHSIRTH